MRLHQVLVTSATADPANLALLQADFTLPAAGQTANPFTTSLSIHADNDCYDPAMAKVKKPAQSQAQRFLEAVKKAQADQSGQKFSQAMGKMTMAQNARKTGKGQVGG